MSQWNRSAVGAGGAGTQAKSGSGSGDIRGPDTEVQGLVSLQMCELRPGSVRVWVWVCARAPVRAHGRGCHWKGRRGKGGRRGRQIHERMKSIWNIALPQSVLSLCLQSSFPYCRLWLADQLQINSVKQRFLTWVRGCGPLFPTEVQR